MLVCGGGVCNTEFYQKILICTVTISVLPALLLGSYYAQVTWSNVRQLSVVPDIACFNAAYINSFFSM